MLTTGNAATDALFQSGAHQKARLLLYGQPLPNPILTIPASDIMQNGVKIRRSAVSGNTLEFGSVIAADCTIQLYNRDGKYNNVQFLGNMVVVNILDDTETDGVNVGALRIDNISEKNGIITVQAMDCMAMLDIPYVSGDISFPVSLRDMMKAVRSKLDNVYGSGQIFFDQSKFGADMDIFPSIYTIGAEPSGDFSYRQLFSWALQIIGKSAYASPNQYNTITLGEYSAASAGNLYKSHRINSEIDKTPVEVNSVTISGDYQRTGDTPIYDVNAGDNPLYNAIDGIAPATPETVKTAVRAALLASVRDKPYYPMTATVLPCPLYMPFDLLRFYTDESNYKETYITDVAWTLNKNVQLTSVGISTTTNSYTPNSPVTARQADYIRNAIQTEQGNYIVEEGVQDGWNYRKWKNGQCDCWRQIYKSGTVSSSINSDLGFYTLTISSTDYPFTFLSRPWQQVSWTKESANCFVIQTGINSTTATGNITICNNKTNGGGGTVSGWLSIEARGTLA